MLPRIVYYIRHGPPYHATYITYDVYYMYMCPVLQMNSVWYYYMHQLDECTYVEAASLQQ